MGLAVADERLGYVEMTTAAATSGIIGPFPPCKWLTIHIAIAGMSASAIPALRFGTSAATQAVDTATTNYADFNHPSTGSTTAGSVWANYVPGVSQSMMRLDSASDTVGRMITVEVMSRSGATTSSATWHTRLEGSVTTSPRTSIGHGGYSPTTAGQITCVQLLTTVTTATLSVGSGLVVYGHPAAM